ncbi:hypothetical protein HB364_08955 [Pseudoflavitalea sp. X16]|uniref:hypothetical protein n=1 Tax=Paraflavitalea devenefica TaxID=2716334 RepID=UPI001422A93D|nr:hypothetical protein [Paraflavitalea devenefica]NII25207.1 hypothetical protein [Paraflavitalea devenefica]
MKLFWKILSLPLIAAIVYCCIVLGLIGTMEGYHPLYPMIDTQHPKGYSISAFNKIKPGDPADNVFSLVGPPLYSTTDSLTMETTLWYTADGRLLKLANSNRGYKDFAWYRSILKLDSTRKVTTIDKGWSND